MKIIEQPVEGLLVGVVVLPVAEIGDEATQISQALSLP
jgi:hypothetical protein